MRQLGQDIRFTARSLAKQPGFTLAAIVTLALGIGANTAIFSVVDSVLLQKPPFQDADRVVIAWAVNPAVAPMVGSEDLPASTANLLDLEKEATSFEAVAQTQQDRQTLIGQGEPEQLGVVLTTPNFFKVLGTQALIGRTLGPDDETPGAPLATVLSYSYWTRRFNGDPGVVGKKFVMNGKPLTVVGIMPRGFAWPRASELPTYMAYPTAPDAWVPLALTAASRQNRSNRMCLMIGKLKPGVTPQAAEQELDNLSQRLAELYPETDKGWSLRVIPIVEQMQKELRPVLLILGVAVQLVLLIACANVANLLLARAASRQKEIALRTAIGAGRRRIISQLLVESAALSLLGGALGAFLAWAFLRLCAATLPPGLVGAASFTLDGRSLLFTLGLCVVASLLAGLVPALQMTRPDLARTLREGTRAGAGTAQSRRTRGALVVAEVAIAAVVLIGAGLLLRSFAHLMDVDPGFRPDHVLTFKVDLPADRKPDDLANFYARLDQELNAVAGAQSAALVSDLPMSGGDSLTAVLLDGKPAPKPGEMNIVSNRMVTPQYFDTLGIRMKKGRPLLDSDTRDKALVAVIDEAMADTYWPGEEALGKRFKRLDGRAPWITVVGIAKSMRHNDLYSDPRPTVFMTPDQTTLFFMPYQTWGAVRTEADPRAFAASIRSAVYKIDRNQPIALVRPLTDLVNQSITKSRLSLLLLAILATLALVLAIVGIYGITSYSVTQRTREIGLRMALGAPPAEVLRLVVRETGSLAIAGIVLGVGLAYLLTRVAASQLSPLLFKVPSTDPLTFVGVALILGLVALGAAWLPGRRATRVSPMVALRTD